MALSPISFLERASISYGDKTSIIYGTNEFTWKETYERCLKLASSLCHLGISHGDIVVALAPNIPALYELHFGVPMAGAILSALNTRLDAPTLSLLLQQLEAKVIFVDYQYINVVLESLKIFSERVNFNPPIIIIISELNEGIYLKLTKMPSYEYGDYEDLVARGEGSFEIRGAKNELDTISINYTSGSTGTPKGVMYSHRGTYLNSLAQIFRTNMSHDSVFLWTVDMFRCNGWCFPWAVAALGGTNICLRSSSGKTIFDSIIRHDVTHMCGAPVLLTMIADFDNQLEPVNKTVEIMIAGALPKDQVMSKVVKLGFNVTHSYGMTEALGPAMIVKTRKKEGGIVQTTRHDPHLIEIVDVKNQTTLKSVPPDGVTTGEVMFKGANLMMGYFKSPKATQAAFAGDWYRTGDLGVRHKDGHIEMKDRIEDVIISDSAIISTMEVEAVLISHPSVSEAAVIGKFDPCTRKIVPWAFVKLKNKMTTTTREEIISFCNDKLSGHMVPHCVVFGDLPVNSTGKVQKFVLRERIKENGFVL